MIVSFIEVTEHATGNRRFVPVTPSLSLMEYEDNGERFCSVAVPEQNPEFEGHTVSIVVEECFETLSQRIFGVGV